MPAPVPFSPSMQWSKERAACARARRILQSFAQVLEESRQERVPAHEIVSFEEAGDAAPLLAETLGEGTVRIALHGGRGKLLRTGCAHVWILELGETKSFLVARVPGYVELLAARAPESGFPAVPESLKEAFARARRAPGDRPAEAAELGIAPEEFGRLWEETCDPLMEIEAAFPGRLQVWRRTVLPGLWLCREKTREGSPRVLLFSGFVPAGVFASEESAEEDQRKLEGLQSVAEALCL